MVSLAGARQFGTRVYGDVSDKNVTFMAAGLAYNAFVSLAPLLLILFVVLNVVGGGLEARVVDAAQQYLPGPIADVVSGLFSDDAGSGGASVIGFVVLVWGALKIFRGLDTAFSEIYETTAQNSLVDKFRDGVVVFGALVVAVLATVGASAAVALFADAIPLLSYASPLVLLGGLVLAFLPMYYVFPDVDVGIRDVLPGAAFAAVGWAAFQALFQVYLSFSDPGSSSFFGGVVVVVTYLYFSALVLLVGAVINAVTGEHSSGRPGGVGRGAAQRRTNREASLDRDELGAYLRGLDERLTARYEPPASEPDGNRPPRPEGPVQLVESVEDEADGQRWRVELSWPVSGERVTRESTESAPAPADD
ncbi:YihY/virulence factor BrkB family protein [Halosimplex amylolyticum]|uniref:YihY/virulence factor BrkB family protein n=1 Tax=Halosimplex amylolyticum TaxID=3396616 RepID=UPI003F573622